MIELKLEKLIESGIYSFICDDKIFYGSISGNMAITLHKENNNFCGLDKEKNYRI